MQIQALPPAIRKRAQQLEMPVLYATAIKAIQACSTMDETKYYADKADALAAYAKMYSDETMAKEAARQKLYAYAKMGQLAGELRPTRIGGKGGSPGGPISLLMEHGLSSGGAEAARRLSKMPAPMFESVVEAAKAPISTIMQERVQRRFSEAWGRFNSRSCGPASFLRLCMATPARELAQSLTLDEAAKAGLIFRQLADWIDEFERCLPKTAGQ